MNRVFNPFGRMFRPFGGGDERYLLRDDFADTVPGGSVNGTASTPGPGIRTVTGTGISIGGGVLNLPNAASNSIYWSLAAGASDIPRVAGRAIRWSYPTKPTSGAGYFGMFEGATQRNSIYHAYDVTQKFLMYIYDQVAGVFHYVRRQIDHPNATPQEALVQGSDSVRTFFSDSFFTELAWIGFTAYTNNFRFGSNSVTLNGTIDSVLINDTNIKSTASGLTLDQSNPVTGTEYETTNANDLARGLALHVININVPNPLSGELEIYLRYLDADNYYSISINASGDVRYRWRIAGSNSDTTALAKVLAGDSLVIYARMSEYLTYISLMSGTTMRSSRTEFMYAGNYWNAVTEATVKVASVTDFVVTRWRAWALVSSDYAAISIQRSGKSFLSLGDSKTADYGWQGTLRSSLNALGNDQWHEWPGMIATGGWTIANLRAVIDARIAYRYGYPTKILMNFGSNELGSALPAEATWKNDYRYCIEALHAAYPDASIYLAKPVRLIDAIPPSTPVVASATLWGWIDDLVAEYSYVYAGIDETALEGGDSYLTNLVDYTHYTAAGKTAVTGLWKTAIGY